MNRVTYWLLDHRLTWGYLRDRFRWWNVRMWARNGFRRPQGLGVATDEGYRCADCGEDPTQLYLVKDRLWRKAGMGPSGALCIPCLEKRLGRKLRPRDFLHGAPAT